MKLPEYLGMRGRWPPPARPRKVASAPLNTGRDILLRAYCLEANAAGQNRVSMSTVFETRHYAREMDMPDSIAARIFCDFLNAHIGETIDEISKVDVKFLG